MDCTSDLSITTIRANKQHTVEKIMEGVLCTGQYDPTRRSGRTLAKALMTLATAMSDPEGPCEYPPDEAGDVAVRTAILDIVTKLSLNHIFTTSHTVTYRPFKYIQVLCIKE